MKVLVFGQSGQVAREMQALAQPEIEIVTLSRAQADLSDPAGCSAQIDMQAPDMVINAAAYTAVDNAETEEADAKLINADAPGAMALACAARGVPFVHISTDYVFDGTGQAAWTPDMQTGPVSAYGRTKLQGEEAVRAAGGAWAILRTSWVFSAHGNNFVKTMLRLGADRDSLSIVGDQIGGPTAARDIAQACLTMAMALRTDPTKSGIYHFSGGPDVSWADFAAEIFTQANLACDITAIPSADYPTPAKRPLNSRMDCSATQTVFDIPRPDWRVSLSQVLAELDRA